MDNQKDGDNQPVSADLGTPIELKTASDKENKKQKNKKKIAICAGVIAVLAIAGGITVAILLNQNKGDIAKNVDDSAAPEKEAASEYKIEGDGLSDFDLKFLQIENNGKNLVYSPLSIKYALAMLADGTDGDSNTQITNILGDFRPKSYINSKNRSLANAMFVRDNFKDSILPTYTEDLRKNYNAEVVYDSFASANGINKWVSDKTLGIVNNLTDDTTVSHLDFALINALAIDMNWNNQLQCSPDLGKKSGVPCMDYSVDYAHEKYSEDIVPTDLNLTNFDGAGNVKTREVGASINNYDIIKEIGEEKIRETVKAEYEKWYEKDKVSNQQECPRLRASSWATDTEKEIYCGETDKVINRYIEELAKNYGRTDISTDFYLYDDENVKVFAKDLQEYDGSTLQYIGIMPKQEELSKYVAEADAKKVDGLVAGLKSINNESFKQGVVTKITGYIPLFNFDAELLLKDDLGKLGIKDIFQDTADLSKMTTAKDEYISTAIHKANIDFSNDGIRAAAVTMAGGQGSTGGGFDYLWDVPVETIDITFDKPYMFLIRDKATGAVWFAGSVYQPTQG